MKKLACYFIKIYIVLLFCSCGYTTPKYLYAPNTSNLIQVEKKDDLKIATSYSNTSHSDDTYGETKQKSAGLDFQGAYGLSKNLGLKLDFYTKKESEESLNDQTNLKKFNLTYKRKGVELSVGYHTYIGRRAKNIFNVYTGVGFGNNSFKGKYRDSLLNNNYYSANHIKWFITPSINFRISKNYSLILAYNVAILRYKNIKTNDMEFTKIIYTEIRKKSSVFGGIVLDNQFSFNKIKNVKFHFLIASNILLNNFTVKDESINGSTSTINGQYQYNDSYFSTGIILDMKKIIRIK
jgi:Outer membrane protein beta-barrel domain